MNFSHAVASTTQTFILLALSAATVLAVAFVLAAAGPASAGNGGLGMETGDKGAGNSGKAGKVDARYKRVYSNFKRKHKKWARQTARCESGKDPKAIGGGGIYRGAFQFLKSTWKTSPKSPGGDPIKYRYKTQAVVAIALKKRDGAGHWPVCG